MTRYTLEYNNMGEVLLTSEYIIDSILALGFWEEIYFMTRKSYAYLLIYLTYV